MLENIITFAKFRPTKPDGANGITIKYKYIWPIARKKYNNISRISNHVTSAMFLILRN